MPRGAWWVGLALVLAVASALSAVFSGADARSRVLVASEALAVGEDLEAALLDDRVAFRDVAGVDRLAGLIGDADDLSGARLAVPLEEGEPITHATLGGVADRRPEVAPDERLLSIPLPAVGAVAAAVAPGVTVDVVASTVEGTTAVAGVVAERAQVVAVEDRVEAIERGAGGVVVRVSDGEALVVTEALATGRDLRLIVRPPDPGGRP